MYSSFSVLCNGWCPIELHLGLRALKHKCRMYGEGKVYFSMHLGHFLPGSTSKVKALFSVTLSLPAPFAVWIAVVVHPRSIGGNQGTVYGFSFLGCPVSETTTFPMGAWATVPRLFEIIASGSFKGSSSTNLPRKARSLPLALFCA